MLGDVTDPLLHYQSRRRRMRMQAYPIRKFLLGYAIALLAWLDATLIAMHVDLVLAVLTCALAYFVCGFFLVRMLSRHIAFHANATVSTVSRAKYSTLVRWPIAVAQFIVQLTWVRV